MDDTFTLKNVELLVQEPTEAQREINIDLLEGPFAELTVAFALGEKQLPELTFPEVRRFEWNDLDIRVHDATVRQEGNALLIAFGISPEYSRQFQRGGHPAKITFADGSKATGDGHLARRGMSVGQQGGSASLEFRLLQWDWDTGGPSDFLMAKVDGLPKIVSDNLTVQRGRRFSSQHFRGEGNALWHFVKRPDGHLAIVERRGTSDTQLRVDLHALEFVFGGDIGLSTFCKVDDAGNIVGALDLDRPSPATHGRRIPVPWGPQVRECWAAHLFNLVVQAYDTDKAVRTALLGYLDALSGHIHSSYLLAQVALEASCSAWHKAARTTLVRDPVTWGKWVDAESSAIQQHASNPELGQQLINKIKSGSIQGSTSDIVASAFVSAGIQLDNSTLKEIRLRNSVAHNYYMATDEALDADVQGAADRIQVIQTLLAMVVALRCGYTGPLAGWTKDTSGHLEPAPVWPDSFPREELRYFTCGKGALVE